jgi:arabinofuranan 3-O-arabinosyltransferase
LGTAHSIAGMVELFHPMNTNNKLVQSLGIFASWRLYLYGSVFAVLWAMTLQSLYQGEHWLVDKNGVPVYTDFTNAFIAGLHARHGDTAALYIPAESLRAQDALVGAGNSFHSTWPYPPTFFLILAPLAILPYVIAFLTWNVATLLAYIAVVYFIVRRPPAIVLVLASPFTVMNIVVGQMGFLTASLLGASMLFLERRPGMAGIFIGCLTYKPQFGILLPLALATFRQWRAFASAIATTALLVGASITAFGIESWEAFPRELFAQASLNLAAVPELINPHFSQRDYWVGLQTAYGLIRTLGGNATLAWFAQGITTCAAALIVWLVWRSPVRYPLKAATLSAAALLAIPYAHAYDLVAIAIPVAFLVRDQIGIGLLRGEQTILLALFGVSLVSNSADFLPLGPIMLIALLGLILYRVIYHDGHSAVGVALLRLPLSPSSQS